MKVLLSWLRDFTPVDGDPTEIGEVLSDLGMAVEEMDRVGDGIDGVVVAEVLALRSHPEADRIQLVDVDLGDGEALQICCGAFNMSVGDRVPLATLGTTMPNGMAIERRKMRGQWSNGMLCAADEIGLGSDHRGIMILPVSAPLGMPVAELLGITGDVRYDLEINPNRPDAMSVAGVARDLAARLGLPFQLPAPEPKIVEGDAASLVHVEIIDTDLCGRFQARVLRGIQPGPSDARLAARLALCGMRPISNVVDVSNYVMLELGQPSHPYDLATVAGATFRVRRAQPGETLRTLDDVDRTFDGSELLICDGDDTAIGIAGVMGGATTEISDSTVDVALEMAWFDPMTIARASRRHGLRSEASARFEKGCDSEVIDLAMERFADLLAPHGAVLVDGKVDRRGELPDRTPVRVRTAKVNAVLGTELGADQLRGYLDPIGFTTTPAGDDLDVALPTWRLDSATEIDVVEEVGRLHGYSNIAMRVPPSVHVGALTERQQHRRRLRRTLIGLGVTEAMPLPFLAPGELERAGVDADGITLLNPLVAEESVLRTSLLPGLLKAIAHNARHRQPDVELFEIGHVFRKPADAAAELPVEREHVACVLAGAEAPAAVALWRAVADAHGISATLRNAEVAALHPVRAAEIVVGAGADGAGGAVVGAVGEIDPGVLAAHDIEGRVGYVELDLDLLLADGLAPADYTRVSRFPSSDIDLAFVVPDEVPAAAVEATLAAAGGELLAELALFDVFRGDSVGEGRRSLAYRLRFQADDRTLTDAEVGEARQACIDAVVATHGATLR